MAKLDVAGYIPECKQDCVKAIMVLSGFDFAYSGTIYLFEMLKDMCSAPNVDHNPPQLVAIADRCGVKLKTLSRCIRFAIDSVLQNGHLQLIDGANAITQTPSTKDVLLILYKNMLDTFENFDLLY